jgi:uncharacterized membrane protein HdeD (DUF308 family)
LLLLALVVLFFLQPLEVSISVVWLIGLYWFIGGIMKLIALFFDASHWGFRLLSALLSLLAGAWIMFPDSGAESLTRTMTVLDVTALIWGVGAVLAGGFGLAAAIRAKSALEALFPVVELLLGVYLLTNLFTTALYVPYVYAIGAGLAAATLIAAGLNARSSIS